MPEWLDFLLTQYILLVPAIIIGLSVHEFSHALIAYKLGDYTAKEDGRLTLNPFHHIDIVGLICLFILKFGWAKPVSVNPMTFKNPKRGMMWTALAGPVSNFITAFIFSFLYCFYIFILKITNSFSFLQSDLNRYIQLMFVYIILINIGLGLFNLILLPPLDGSRILGGLVSDKVYVSLIKAEKYAPIFFIAIIFLSYTPFDILKPLTVLREFIYEGFLGLWSGIFGI